MSNSPTAEQLKTLREHIKDPKTRMLAEQLMALVTNIQNTMPELAMGENGRFIVGFVGDKDMVTMNGLLNSTVAFKVILCMLKTLGTDRAPDVLINVIEKYMDEHTDIAEIHAQDLKPKGKGPIVN